MTRPPGSPTATAQLHRGSIARHLEDDVQTATVRGRQDRPAPSLGVSLAAMTWVAPSALAAARRCAPGSGGDDRGGTRHPSQGNDKQADRPSADDADGGTSTEPTEVDAVDRDGQWFRSGTNRLRFTSLRTAARRILSAHDPGHALRLVRYAANLTWRHRFSASATHGSHVPHETAGSTATLTPAHLHGSRPSC